MSAETQPVVASRGRFPWPRLALGLAILLCGLVLGSGATFIFRHEVFRLLNGRGPEHHRPLEERLAEKMELTPEQTEAFGRIYEKHWQTMVETQRAAQPAIREAIDRLDAEVRPMLDATQRAAWEEKMPRLRFFIRMRLSIEANRQAVEEEGGEVPWPPWEKDKGAKGKPE